MNGTKNKVMAAKCDIPDSNGDSRLHAARKRLSESVGQDDAIEGLREIVANFIGSEEMGLFLVDRKTGFLRFFWSFGSDLENHDLAQTMGETALHRVMRGECYIRGAVNSGTEAERVQAFIPIRVVNTTVAVLALLRLLPQKNGFDQSDTELFQFISNEAAQSLFRTTSAETAKTKGAGLGK